MLSPNEILRYWQIKHQHLSSVQSAAFVRKDEILKLCLLPEEFIYEAIRKDNQLTRILEFALDLTSQDLNLSEFDRRNYESLSNSDAIYCPHKIKSFLKCDQCRSIRPHLRQKEVWMSGGGGKFHYDKYCEFARSAQLVFSEKGGSPLGWFSGSENVVKWSRKPCVACVINKPLSFEWFKEPW